MSLQTANPTFTVHVVDIPDTNMRVELCIFDVPGDLYCRESSLKLVRTSTVCLILSLRRDHCDILLVRAVRGCRCDLRGV